MANSRALTASLLGAAVGSIAGYLLFTEEGRSLRHRIESALEDLTRELANFRLTIQRVAGVVSEGRKLFDEAMAEERSRYPTVHQSSPF